MDGRTARSIRQVSEGTRTHSGRCAARTRETRLGKTVDVQYLAEPQRGSSASELGEPSTTLQAEREDAGFA